MPGVRVSGLTTPKLAPVRVERMGRRLYRLGVGNALGSPRGKVHAQLSTKPVWDGYDHGFGKRGYG